MDNIFVVYLFRFHLLPHGPPFIDLSGGESHDGRLLVDKTSVLMRCGTDVVTVR